MNPSTYIPIIVLWIIIFIMFRNRRTVVARQIFDIWTQAINLCVPLMGVNLLCQTYTQWNTSRKSAYFSLGCAVIVFVCAFAVFFIK